MPLDLGTQLRRLALPRLDRPAAGSMVAAIAGRHRLIARLGSEILARSDGIPLFIEEMTKAVIETAPAGEAASVLTTLRDALMKRSLSRRALEPEAIAATQMRAPSRRLRFDLRDRAQIFVDCGQVPLGFPLVERPRHDLQQPSGLVWVLAGVHDVEEFG